MILVLTKICMVISGFLLAGGFAQWLTTRGDIRNQKYILGCAISEMEQEQIRLERQMALEEEEARVQKTKVFAMDFRITHGSAFGGFCATMNDGRKKKGSVSLDHILLHGRHPSGKEFTYYIEEQGIDICACDEADQLKIRSNGAPFEIRQYGQSRDEGVLLQSAIIQRDIQYYIILESKHEISIKAVKGC